MFSKSQWSKVELFAYLTCLILSSHPSTGRINNCEWDAKVVRTLDIMNTSLVIPKPTAKPIDVRNIINKLKIYGIETDDHGYRSRLLRTAMLVKTQPIITICLGRFTYDKPTVCYQCEAAMFKPYDRHQEECVAQQSIKSKCNPFWVVPLITSDDVVIDCSIETRGSSNYLMNKRFYVRLQGTLNNPAAKIATPRDYKVTREFKHVVMQCVTQVVGPFEEDDHYLLSSTDFNSQSPVYQVSYKQYLTGDQLGEWSHNPYCTCSIQSDYVSLPGRFLFATKYGIVLVWGIKRDGPSATAERLLPKLCFNRLSMHSMSYAVTIVLHGACDDIGKVYIGTTTTALQNSLNFFALADSIETSPSPCYTFYNSYNSCRILDAIPGKIKPSFIVLVQPYPGLVFIMQFNRTDEYWRNISSIDAHSFNMTREDFVLTGFKIMPYLSDHVYIWGPNILLHSADYGVLFSSVKLPQHVKVQQVAVGAIGMWLAVLAETPDNKQEIYLLIVGFEQIAKVFPDPLLLTLTSVLGIPHPERKDFTIVAMFCNTQQRLTMLTTSATSIVSYSLPVEQLLAARNQAPPPFREEGKSKLCPFSEILFQYSDSVSFTQQQNYIFFAPRLSTSDFYDSKQFIVYNAIIFELIAKQSTYFSDYSRYTNYKFDYIESRRQSVEERQDYGRFLYLNHHLTENDVYISLDNFKREYQSVEPSHTVIFPDSIYLDYHCTFTFNITTVIAENQTIDDLLHVISSDNNSISASFSTGVNGTTVTYQVSLHNVGPLVRQHSPGVDLLLVNIDLYFDGAPMNCYKSSGPLFNRGTDEGNFLGMYDANEFAIHNGQGFYHFAVLSGCPPTETVFFDWRSTSDKLEDNNKLVSDCATINVSMPCFYYANMFHPSFLLVDMASGKQRKFDGKYSLKIVAITSSLSSNATYFTYEEILHYNNMLHATSLYSIWQPVNTTMTSEDGWPIYNGDQNGIVWVCLFWSPCSNVPPQLPNSPDIYFLIEFTNALIPRVEDVATFCNHTMRFWLHLHGLPFDTVRIGIPVLALTVIILLAICAVYFILMRNDAGLLTKVRSRIRQLKIGAKKKMKLLHSSSA